MKTSTVFLFILSITTSCFADQATRIMIEKYQPPILEKDSTYSLEKFDTITIWIGEHRSLNDETRSPFRIITCNDSNQLFLLQPKFEIYEVFVCTGVRSGDSVVTVEQDLTSGLGQLRPVEAWTITATGDTTTIRNVGCHRYEFLVKNEYGEQVSDVWISDARDEQLPAFQLAYHGLSFFMNGSESFAEELKKVQGFPLLTVSRGKVRRTEEIISIDTVQVDSQFFEIPESYEKY